MRPTIQLSGRLGNQLFQWSFAHNISLKSGKQVGLFLDKFHSASDSASAMMPLFECEHVSFEGYKNTLGRELKMLDWMQARTGKPANVLSSLLGWERSLTANTTPVNLSGRRKYSGFFQDYRQVISVENVLMPELLNLQNAIMDRVQTKLKFPQNYQFAHIRRGDLVSSHGVYGLLGLEWYLINRNSDLPLIVSTDDIYQAREIIEALKPEFILNPSEFSAVETLFIMGCSTDAIMGNSTLSWWGGYLAGKNGAKVHFPDPFYRDNFAITDALCMPNFERKSSTFI